MNFFERNLRPFALNSTLASGHDVDPKDVIKSKQALQQFGHYKIPEHGLTSLPDVSLFDGLKTFQRRNGLKEDGIMKPHGPTARKIDSLLAGADEQTGSPRRPAVSTSPPDTPWWRSKRLPQISGNDFSANGRAVETLLRTADTGDHARWTAEDIAGGNKNGIGVLGDLLQQLENRDPERAKSYHNEVMNRLPEQAQRKVMSLVDDVGEWIGDKVDKVNDRVIEPAKDIAKSTAINVKGTDKEVRGNLQGLAKRYHDKGYPESANNLDHFLNGDGKPRKVTREQARKEKFYREAETENRQRFEQQTFLGTTEKNDKINNGLKNLKDGETLSFDDHWDVERGATKTYAKAIFGTTGESDDALAKGRKKLRSSVDFKATRNGGTVHIEGIVTHNGDQKYDFENGDLGDIMGAKRLQDRGMAKPFDIKRTWKQKVTGTVEIGLKGKLQNPKIRWTDIPQ